MAAIGTNIQQAKTLLEKGELVAIPTETVYGLAGNAMDALVVAKIFLAKNRPRFDPIIVHVPNLTGAITYVQEIPQKAKILAEKFWPGPLTMLLKRKSSIPDLVTAGLDTVGIRCPDHPLTLELLAALPFPLAAPSANPFGYVSPTKPEHVNEQLGDQVSYILDGGSCRVGIESTIIGFETNGQAVIHRLGGLSLEQIEHAIGKVAVQLHSTSNPKAPGQLKSHYAPQKKILFGNVEDLIAQSANKVIGVISFQRDFKFPYQVILSPSGNTEEAARNLFTALRTLDKMPVEIIVAERVPEDGLGRAINDRLGRAAAK